MIYPNHLRIADARDDRATGYTADRRGVILCDDYRCDNTADRNGELCDECKAKQEEADA